ncbi:3-keto-5-aminohexanoate cleavage protein [Alteromonas sp. BL110]|uniref:3-keto-5-aminohexanoate cleavage protein n=1 Tax=Alteromonas sp. BL110 TaxID=1714845 RepID=UPI000E5278E1|nr:3-keto-5-aminohexanoate cleavage protein [Alteromonas sp. BL110]AXT39269.1 3-keto-5-aminohexanoate cleavage protein [Alteromonas sp. BL110]RKM82247.1 3-keto-5-aminohexanoate cleavage protein [Alteromonas sp. BL110]
MKKNRKVIITCAVTGAMHTPTMSDALPITPEEIADESVKAAQAGASIIHLHARDPETGQPTGDPEVFMKFLPAIKERTDAVINLTTGGSPTMSVEERLACAMKVQPEMCSLNMGSINFAMFPLASRYKQWKHSWEEEYVRNSDDFIFRNTFRDIEKIMTIMSEFDTKFEHECYDVGHLYNLAHFADRGLIKPPFFIQTIFGILGGIGADEENLMYMKSTADRLFGDDYQWSVLAAGKNQMPFSTQSALMGGNVRVGLEDSLFINKGEMATSNAQQVEKIKRVLSEFSLDIATPDETREILGLKGKDNVNF